jgi:hypothetical protein
MFVKQDLGRCEEAGAKKSRRLLRIRDPALSAEWVWIKSKFEIDSDCCGATFLLSQCFKGLS